MAYDETSTKKRIQNTIIYNSIILLIFIYWFYYSTEVNISVLLMICLSIFFIILTKFMVERKSGFESKDILLYVLLFFIPFSLFTSITFYSNDSFSFFIPFNNLEGIVHNHNFSLFLIYFGIILLKLFGIRVYFSRNKKILEVGRGDEIFQFFTKDLDKKKILLLILLFPLVAFIEELIYRSLLISVFTYYLNFNYAISIIIISFIFGLVHYSTSQNWGHVISTLLSSIIYSLALIQLGILYPWIFHLITNLVVLFFYFRISKKVSHQDSSINS
jgi:membrane protease YdiL (CAAX protease family)